MSAYFNEFILIADYHKRLPDINLATGMVGVQAMFFYETGYYDKGGSWRVKQHHLTVKAWGKTGDQLKTLYGPGDKLLLRCEVTSHEYKDKFYPEITVKHVMPFDSGLRKISDKISDDMPEISDKPENNKPTKKDDESDLPF